MVSSPFFPSPPPTFHGCRFISFFLRVKIGERYYRNGHIYIKRRFFIQPEASRFEPACLKRSSDFSQHSQASRMFTFVYSHPSKYASPCNHSHSSYVKTVAMPKRYQLRQSFVVKDLNLSKAICVVTEQRHF